MRMMTKLLGILLLVSISGCAGFSANLREKRQADLRQRASFEFSCPADQLQITPLDDNAASHGGGTTGVSGCGKKATYIWDAFGTGWIMNSKGRPSN